MRDLKDLAQAVCYLAIAACLLQTFFSVDVQTYWNQAQEQLTRGSTGTKP